ncbi:spore germination protein GerPC [Gracilibacillus sp. S3-1-1]|uniref:Spore germination protein GerPC n=1 Tax=Gracilibacillus pellucidus TaxID=3095368 RepID=A0ACC6M463_9BACI|nr:spore germination protein GerPC [Gracilibacillus sp. S3-1-1]MDX8045759.1 spore germination protein GerPC [Gracilibacillus sp. S3-1-1]
MDYQMMVYYITQLQQHVQQLHHQINSLEQRLQKLEQKQGNKTNIEKLEYHFDQLKIERLDGALHIGITPEDLQSIDELSIPGQHNGSMPPIHQALDQYVQEELPEHLQALEQEYQFPLDPIYRQTLLNDMRQQLAERITHYSQDNVVPEQMNQHIMTNVKKELHTGLKQWFINKQKEQ